MRAGNVDVANALGSGVVETPAMLPFLPGLCRQLLGEDSLLPSVPTWWCGQPRRAASTCSSISTSWSSSRRSRDQRREPVFGAQLERRERKRARRARSARDPTTSSARSRWRCRPRRCGTADRLEPRPIVLRAYVAAAAATRYAVMPGGLTRVADAQRRPPIVSMQRGGGSKDTWVLSDGPVSAGSLLAPPAAPVASSARPADLPSRVADNLFWLGRYAERAEHLVRAAAQRRRRGWPTGHRRRARSWRRCCGCWSTSSCCRRRFGKRMPLRELEAEMLVAPVQAEDRARRPARHAGRAAPRSPRWSATASRSTPGASSTSCTRTSVCGMAAMQFDDVLVQLNRMITDLAAFSGMEMENMTRGHGWRFLDIGRRLERSANLTRPAAGGADGRAPRTAPMLGPLLEIADSTMTYRRRYFAQPQLAPVLDLLCSPTDQHPRRWRSSWRRSPDHVDQLPRDPGAPSPTRERLHRHATRQRRSPTADRRSAGAVRGGWIAAVD